MILKFVIFVMMIKFTGSIVLVLLQLIFPVSFSFVATAQTKTEQRKIYAEAESRYLFEEYELANPLYLLLETEDNFNIKHKIGACYLNIPGEKEKAIPYLEAAVRQSSFDARINSFREKRAPLDSYFLLAKAYMINNELEKALSAFNKFKSLAQETEVKGRMKNLDYVDQMIQACNNAINNQEDPFRISKRRLGKQLSQGSVNENPAVSFDGNTIVYTERRGLINALMFSKKISGKWQTPVEINSQLNSGDDCSSCSLNSDGTVLYLYKTDNFDGNIYSSRYENGGWTPITKLNRNINTKYYESHAAIAPDGKRLYFTSNRDGGQGGLDIYVSELDAFGDWGPAINLGLSVNTIYNEDTPFITINDSLLYFASEGHSGMGGFDIYRSSGNGRIWGTPENLGYPINTTDDDRFFQPFNNDENGFYSINTDYKKKEIFYITLTNYRLDRVYELSGKYSLKDTIVEFDERNAIYLIDKASGDTVDTGFPDASTGNYSFMAAPGAYRLLYTAPGYLPQRQDTTIVSTTPPGLIKLDDIILDKNPPAGERLDLSDIPIVDHIDPDILIKDLRVYDVTDNDLQDTTILYYTVQVMALYNPVDISYFRYVDDIRVFYNASDFFYRYTTGVFKDKNDAYAHRDMLFGKGYPTDLFIKKVIRGSDEKDVPSMKSFSIQLKATSVPVDIAATFPGLKGVRETKEVDGMYHYLYGSYSTAEEAKTIMKRSELMEYGDAFVRETSILLKK